jgi:hypothetical protein
MCKSKSQAYACALFSSISDDITEVDNISTQLILVKELRSFVEIQGIMSSRLDCLRYAKVEGLSEMAQRVDRDSMTCCTLPMYIWLPVSNEMISKFDCRMFSEANIIGKKVDKNLIGLSDKLLSAGKAELSNLLDIKENFIRAKVLNNDRKLNFESNFVDSMITSSLTLRMLVNLKLLNQAIVSYAYFIFVLLAVSGSRSCS